MRVHLFNDQDSGRFADSLLGIGDRSMTLIIQGCISLKKNFCNLVENEKHKCFPDLQYNNNGFVYVQYWQQKIKTIK